MQFAKVMTDAVALACVGFIGPVCPLVDGEEAQRALQVLWELMVQCGPVANLHLPRDKITTTHQGCDLGPRDPEHTVQTCKVGQRI